MNMIRFTEVTDQAGIQSVDGISFGASWGDLNQDALPDLWVSNHFDPISLYLNQGDNTFIDIAPEVFQDSLSPSTDTHAAAWADFDNDGDSDIIQFVGAGGGVGSEANFLFFNTLIERRLADSTGESLQDLLVEEAEEQGVDSPLSRSRTPLWFDFDQDSWLDLVTSTPARPDNQSPPTIFRQTDTGFEDVGDALGFTVTESDFSMIADLFGDGRPELFTSRRGRLTVFEVSEDPFEAPLQPITDTPFSRVEGVEDIAFADFNNDQRLDIYFTRASTGGAGLNQVTDNIVKASLNPKSEEDGFQFNTTGTVTFNFRAGDVGSSQNIFIGSTGINPSEFQFTLSPDAPNVQGILPHLAGEQEGIYIGYDPDQQQWQVLYSQPDRGILRVQIDSEELISNLTALGFDPAPEPVDDVLLINTENGFEDRSEAAGIDGISIVGKNVVAGDFDNDQDTDLYLVSSQPTLNVSNVLLENQGDATFLPVTDAGGAAGTRFGVGDSVAVADYNLDGFLDLFVTNALFPGVLASDGPDQLFQNQGNDNSWFMLDLVGTESNRDGVGTRVELTSNGVTQLREQSGGIHRRSQNHQRLHFGLGENQIIDELVIQWPSGIEQRLENIAANQILQVTEPSLFSPGQPQFVVGETDGVFLWKDTFDGPYSLRTSGAGDLTVFQVDLITSDTLSSVREVDLEPNDVWTVSEFGASLQSSIVGQQDGFDFQLTPGQSALLSVTQDSTANSEQLTVGAEGINLHPVGWILPSDELPQRPTFTQGQDLGLFFGQSSTSDTVEFRWNGDGNLHSTQLTALTSEPASFIPVDLDSGGPGKDTLRSFANGVEIRGAVGTLQDGLDVTDLDSSLIGFIYEQDGEVSTSAVNPDGAGLGTPNAYWIPLPSPQGAPDYDLLTDAGLFLWQGTENRWHLRTTGDADGNIYKGSIVSNQMLTQLESVDLESNDILNTTNPNQIEFELTVFQGFRDGFDFQVSPGASLALDLDNSIDNITSLVKIGGNKWPISQSSVDLTNWA